MQNCMPADIIVELLEMVWETRRQNSAHPKRIFTDHELRLIAQQTLAQVHAFIGGKRKSWRPRLLCVMQVSSVTQQKYF